MLSKQNVIEIGNRLGFEIVRFCSPEPFSDYERTVKERIRGGLYPKELIDWERLLDRVEVYADPANVLPGARSVISIAFSYYTEEPTDLTRLGEPHGVLSRSYQRDVYGEMYRRQKRFAEHLRKRGLEVYDGDLMPLKRMAVAAGVGWQGKNSLIINEEYGSWITLHGLVVDAEFEPDEPSSGDCGPCQACIRACPTSAIQSPGVINVNRCIDYLTCRTGIIPRELRGRMGNRIVSCDRCQEVCPHNMQAKSIEKNIPRHNPSYRHSPALLPLLDLSDDEFKKHYLDCDFIDSRSDSLKRNAIVALGNLGDPIALPKLKKLLEDPNSLLRSHSAWALGRFEEKEAREALKERLALELDPAVKDEILYALGRASGKESDYKQP